MARQLVVEAERAVERRVVAHIEQPGIEAEPAQRLRLHRGDRPAPGVGRLQRVARQQVLQVGEDQLLVLLFVGQAQRDQRFDFGRHGA